MFFSVLAGIIPLSLRREGAFDTVCPPPCLQVGGGQQLPPLPPPSVSPPMDNTQESCMRFDRRCYCLPSDARKRVAWAIFRECCSLWQMRRATITTSCHHMRCCCVVYLRARSNLCIYDDGLSVFRRACLGGGDGVHSP